MPHHLPSLRLETMLQNPGGIPARHTDGGGAPFAWRGGKLLSRGKLWSDVRALARQLPDHAYVINLCADRYLFCLTLLAAMARGQVCLLPPAGLEGILREILRDYPDAYLASEQAPSNPCCDWFAVAASSSPGTAGPLAFDDAQTALIAFTSGSTGRPKACAHRFGTFRVSARMALSSLGLGQTGQLMVSTTPPQHMYGLETSVFWPLFSDLVMYAGRPFFPEDIRRVIESAPLPAVLASTPTHLRSLAGQISRWGNLAGILSSTAQLSVGLARETEATLGASLQEIYGSTETLSFASRATVGETHWRPYPGAVLAQDGQGQTLLMSPHLDDVLPLQDRVQIETDGCFSVLGRASDMVKIGGKRTSLAELNRRLAEIEGVTDGMFFVREYGGGECRMGAVVVSGLDRQSIRQRLKPYLDEVFLPRAIHFVGAIPRNSIGKVVKEEWEALLRGMGY